MMLNNVYFTPKKMFILLKREFKEKKNEEETQK